MAVDDDCDVGVPVSALGHALRTPSNVLGGYARLLAAGDLGPLAPPVRAAVGEMGEAARGLERIIALLDPPLAPPAPAAPREPLAPTLRQAAGAAGWQPAVDRDFHLSGVAWSGWLRLFYALAMAMRAGGAGLCCRGEADGLSLAVETATSGSGDDVLALAMVQIHADAAGLRVVRDRAGLRLAHSDLIAGGGVLILR